MNKNFFITLIAFLTMFLLVSCGPIWYGTKIINAKRNIAAAHENGAGRGENDFARYEITYAEEHLKKAQEEVAKADYQAAIQMAAIAEEYGMKARDIAVRLKMEEGRKKPAKSEITDGSEE